MEILGYEFRNSELLKEALTTPSYRMDCPTAKDNQRLEFLGDAVLGFLSAERLYAAFPQEQEGALTVRRTHMVSAHALCLAAEKFGIAEMLIRNRRAQKLPRDSKIFADAIEAIVGAAYLDGGFEAARKMFESLGLSENVDDGEWCDNPKGELQVRAQAMKPPKHPAYEILKTEGKSHEPVFTARVTVDGIGVATASARTHKQAESLAASKLLREWVSRLDSEK